jgi:hypothetical protein
MAEKTEELMAKIAAEKEARKKLEESKKKEEPTPVSAGPVDKIAEVLINPSDEKMLEFTDLDRNQVTLIPQLGIIDDMWQYLYEIVEHRQDPEIYAVKYERPIPELANPMKRFVYLIAQCRRSLGGKTQRALVDLALADIDARNREEELGEGLIHDEEGR